MKCAASPPLFMGNGQLPDTGMRERQEVREEERERGMRHEPKSKTEEGANEKRGEERLKGEVAKMIGRKGGERHGETANEGRAGR